jgi:AraC-like DNA-binding protein
MDAILDAILDRLSAAPLSGRALCQQFFVSQPTLSRRLAQLGDVILRFGPQRETRYARRRLIRRWDRFALFRITASGQLQAWGVLHPVQPQGYVLQYLEDESGLNDGKRLPNVYFQGLPWWLQDMRPQGFLGRAFAAATASRLDLPQNLGLWQDEHVLLAMAEAGEDTVGNLLVGESARQRWLASAAPQGLPLAQLAGLAQRALAGEAPASSAGGEQPKFAAYLHGIDDAADLAPGQASASVHVLVKFSAPEQNAVAQRWRQVLACEHLALTLLREANMPAAHSALFDTDGQRFLVVRRFDREGSHGRHGLVSLLVLDAEFVGRGSDWPQITKELSRQGKITTAAHDFTCRLYVFGLLIGNSDMHGGNLSFLNDGRHPMDAAPAYDMLPMALAPRSSGLIPTTLALNRLLLPAYPGPEVWRVMLPLARDYWQRVQDSPWIDDDFRLEAAAMALRLDDVQAQLARLT